MCFAAWVIDIDHVQRRHQMAVDNPYGVKAVSEKDASMMRAYTPACVALIEGCQGVPEVRFARVCVYMFGFPFVSLPGAYG